MTVPEGNTAKRTGEISKKVKAFIITEKARARIFIYKNGTHTNQTTFDIKGGGGNEGT